MEPRELSPPQVLEALVSVVATLGELASTVTAPRRSVWPLLYPKSLHTDLRRFTWRLRDMLDHGSVTSPGQHGDTSLSRALAALGATSGVTWANVKTWHDSVYVLTESWFWLVEEAVDLLDTWENVATDKATATTQAKDLQDKTASLGTAGENLVATARQPLVALAEDEVDSLLATHEARVVAVIKAMEESVVATSQAGAATRRGQRGEEALGLLRRLVVECDRATVFPLELLRQLGDIKTTLLNIKERSPNVPEDLVAAVAEAKRLWEASARLTTHHLLVTLGEIDFLLSSPYGGSGGPGGPRGRAVAERCQRAIEDIPRLLEGSGVTNVISSRR
ncbi:uncharacterized protein LOC120764563 [Hirundo rustica]|uniref:uncharacterized protein LOC120764563 n=1 Tax=Hirundo rustica TaxID=43150 RepID=UPI001A941D84|nr:uncharacterized protein LOC120764563 [Hirundo rustica]